jgi:hypothetical protein
MTRITIPDTITAQVRAATGSIELVDSNGTTVAKIVAAKPECPHSLEECRRIVKEESGRSLEKIWKALAVKAN